VGEMIALLAKELGVPLSGALGEALYVAIVTDTGYFSYGNTRPETLRISAEILEQGLDVEKVNNRLQNQWTLNRLKLWSEVMGDAKLYHDGEVATVSIPAEALQRTGASVFDTDGLVNFVRRIKSVRVAISLREEGNNRTKFSLRSNGSLNVQRVAKEFGGGGHRNASGGSLNKPLDKAEKLLVKAVEQALEAAETDEPGEL
jgi:phosphoesterase RecJ-like protein